ncbi:ASCH domain-containing protein [Schleiferilactobacillus harbinensis]|uniref:ASCH domain-containing protein n=1 Tax=Schleiferilactobacillus harbinensis TaxID=304207 RepID=A0A5P8M5D5_9LACO|nr:ASCH domain-containing protein [Schleiferilactobacillus harbinensis]QFR23445.1 ASCH domain-containing protein [Schleiferilactobacillus harbinensis]
MQEWQLHLYQDQFDLLKAGTKTVEIRLRNSDIDKVQPMDIIHFVPAPEDGKHEVAAVVTDINTFDTFEQGLRHFPPTAVGSPREPVSRTWSKQCIRSIRQNKKQ